MAHVAQEAGADAISLVNTFVAMAIDAETRKPRIANVTAGLSGPAIKPIALRMVYDAAKAVKIPIIGMGGISTAVDVVEFMLAGASAVQIGTASYWDPLRHGENRARTAPVVRRAQDREDRATHWRAVGRVVGLRSRCLRANPGLALRHCPDRLADGRGKCQARQQKPAETILGGRNGKADRTQSDDLKPGTTGQVASFPPVA